MEQPTTILPDRTKVRIHDKIERRSGLPGRRPAAVEGIVEGVVPGMGGDVYYVAHGGEVSAYCFDEFELVVSHEERLAVGTRIRTNDTLAAGRPLCGARSPAREGTIQFVMDSSDGFVYTVGHDEYSTAEYHRDEFVLASAPSKTTVEQLTEILAAFEHRHPKIVEDVSSDPDPQWALFSASKFVHVLETRAPYAEQDEIGRDAWNTTATAVAYILLRAIAKSTL